MEKHPKMEMNPKKSKDGQIGASRCKANGIANAAKAMEKEIDFQIRHYGRAAL